LNEIVNLISRWTAKPRTIVKVEVFSLCDFASVDAGGKLNIIGVFDSMWARESPIVYGLCVLAARLRFEKGEEGTKQVKISFIDPDGNLVMPVAEAIAPVVSQPTASTTTAHIITMISQINLPTFGEYSLSLVIDGNQVASTPFYVIQTLSFPPPPSPPPLV
jgi:hypothetical protein